MDLVRVEDVVRPLEENEIPRWAEGDAFLSGGTWLFSEAQPSVSRLVDLSGIRWPALVMTPDRVEIAANCTYERLERTDWSGLPAGKLFSEAIHSLSSSFKTYGLATVGGNICLAFAKGMMTPVFLALGAAYELSLPTGQTRVLPAGEFQKGVRRTVLQPGEYLRRVIVPRSSFARRCALKRASFSATSHVTAMAIATLDPGSGATALTLSGALAYPVRIEMTPKMSALAAIDGVCAHHPLISDAHGSARYRQALLHFLASEALGEVLA